jgi:hypothetical protein
MHYTDDPKGSKGAQIWEHLETLRARLETACMAFDDLYAFAFRVKSENQNRASKLVAAIKESTIKEPANGKPSRRRQK